MDNEEQEIKLDPSLYAEGDSLDLLEVKPTQHFTKPPARYNDASLVKTLEENGIGRPSTYAPTISTIIDRKYVEENFDIKNVAATYQEIYEAL